MSFDSIDQDMVLFSLHDFYLINGYGNLNSNKSKTILLCITCCWTMLRNCAHVVILILGWLFAVYQHFPSWKVRSHLNLRFYFTNSILLGCVWFAGDELFYEFSTIPLRFHVNRINNRVFFAFNRGFPKLDHSGINYIRSNKFSKKKLPLTGLELSTLGLTVLFTSCLSCLTPVLDPDCLKDWDFNDPYVVLLYWFLDLEELRGISWNQ